MHVAITGASSGIGEALAREFAARGAAISLVARRRELMERIIQELPEGSKASIHSADLARVERAHEWIPEAERTHGPIDVLINNAGMQIVAPASATVFEEGEALLRLNLHVPLKLTRALLPAMLARRSGVIVDMASLAALSPMPGMHYYNASKAGLAAASEALRGELRGTGVHVVTVYPGPITTAMGDAAKAKYGNKVQMPEGTTHELARRVRIAVERRQSRVIYPAPYALARHFPGITRFLVDRLTPPLSAVPGTIR